MILSSKLTSFLQACSIRDIAGVPCSSLQPVFNFASGNGSLVMTCSEGDAIAYAAGTWLGGSHAAVCMQNSGLGNCVSPLTSLIQTFRIPLLGFVSLRGEPGMSDEPQHALMGKITEPLLRLLQIPAQPLTKECTELDPSLDTLLAHRDRRESYFFIVQPGSFMPEPRQSIAALEIRPGEICRQIETPEMPFRHQVIAAVLDSVPPEVAIVATTGYTSRELFTLNDRQGNFYMVGSMGCAASIALGIARANPDRKVVILDGDGALLMRLGNLSTTGYFSPPNLFHLLLNNEQHESTGGQATTAVTTDFGLMAHAAGFPRSFFLHTLQELQERLAHWLADPICSFATLPIRSGSLESLGRPTIAPPDIAVRFREFNAG